MDNSLGEAQAILASIKMVHNWDFEGAYEGFRRAVALCPNSANVYKDYIQYLIWTERFAEGLSAAERLMKLAPLDPTGGLFLGFVCFYNNRYDESIAHLKKSLEYNPNFIWAHVYLSHNYLMIGDYEQVVYHADRVEQKDPSLMRYLGKNYAEAGYQDKARMILESLQDESQESIPDFVTIATIYPGLGDKEKALHSLDRGYEARAGIMVYLKVYSRTFFRNISSDPRYTELLQKMGFSE